MRLLRAHLAVQLFPDLAIHRARQLRAPVHLRIASISGQKEWKCTVDSLADVAHPCRAKGAQVRVTAERDAGERRLGVILKGAAHGRTSRLTT